jgi:hypothetical protein
MPVDESRYVACLDCKRGPKFEQYDSHNACSCGWKAGTRKPGCYLGERIPGTKAKKGEQGYTPAVRP